MASKSTRLDRFISQHSDHKISDVRWLIAQNRIVLNGKPADSVQQIVGPFTQVVLDGRYLQNTQPIYIALNKPKGVVSATKDSKHTTVIDLIDHPLKDQLHIAGRLDFNTTGLVLLTNDGAWSRRISLPKTKLPKVYDVTLAEPLNEAYIEAFAMGIHFAYENITTLPAELTILSTHSARLTLHEGKYHQVKRMFGAFQNEVLELHRESVGPIAIGDLPVGQYRPLSEAELTQVTAIIYL